MTLASEEKPDFLSLITEDVRRSITQSFQDTSGDAWVYYKDKGQNEFYSAHSTVFEDYVRMCIYDSFGKPRESWVREITHLAASEARRQGTRNLALRWTVDDIGDWLYQIDQHQVLKVTNQGLEVLEVPPIFRHYSEQGRLVVDMEAQLSDINLLDEFFNFSNEGEYKLFKVILPALLVPDIAKPIMIFNGPPGSAKSMACRLIKQLIDPVVGMEYGGQFITKIDDLFVTCLRNQVLISDNVQDPTPAQQDMMSRLSTGLNINARKLYTNDELVTSVFRRIQLVNSIQFTNLQSDLIDRSFMWELDRISDENRMLETQLLAKFEKLAPRIRGAMFKALWKIRSRKLATTPEVRLVDFARYAIMSGIVFGHDEQLLHRLINLKVKMQQDESLQSSKVALVLSAWLDDRTSWQGSPADLYESLTKYIDGSGQERVQSRFPRKDWYSNAADMGKDLKLVSHNLPFIGWRYEAGRSNGKRWIKLIKVEVPSLSENRSEREVYEQAKKDILEMTDRSVPVRLDDIYARTGDAGRNIVAQMLESGDLAEIRKGEVMRFS